MSALRLLLFATGLCLLGCPRPLPSQLSSSQLVNVSPASDPSVSLAKLPSSLVYVRSFCKRTASQPDVTGTAFVVGHSDGWSYLISARHVLFPRECGPTPHPLAQRVELRGEGVLPFDGDPSELIEKATDSQGDLILFHAQGKRDTAMARLSVLVPEMLGSGAEPMDALGFTTLQARSAQPQSERSRGLLSTNNREGRLVLTTEAKLYPSMSGGPVALRSSGLVVGVVLGEYEAQKGASREGRIATLAPLIDRLPEALRQQLGIVLHYSVNAAYQSIPPQPTWVERPEQAKVLAVLDAVPKGQSPARVLLHGIGGVGKTTLAYQVAALRQSRFPGGTVKVELKDRTTDLVLSDLIEALTGRRPQPDDWFKLVRALLANRPPVLVILDNVRLDSGPWSEPAAMDALLQSLSPATLIMTTRSRSALAGFASIEVESLPESLAIRLMATLRAQHGQSSVHEITSQIVRELGGLPKAIEVASALLYKKQLREVDMLDRLRRGKDRTLEGLLHELFGWSFAALDGEAQQVLLAMGQLAEAPVPSSLLAKLLPDVKQEAAVDRLVASNLAERRHSGRGLEVLHLHTTVWDWARELGPRQQPTLMTALQERMTESLKTHDEQVAPLLLAHLLNAQRLAGDRQQWERVLGLMWGTDDALGTFGYWGARKELLQRALNAAQKGTDRQALAEVLNQLGIVNQSQGDYDAARKFHQQSLDLAQALGDRKVIASNLGNLGIVAQSQGDYDAARKSYQQSLDLAQALGDRQGIANIMLNLGNVAKSQGDYDAARKYYQQSLDLAQALGDRQGIAAILVNLGEVARLQGDYDAARKYYQQSLDLAQALGDRQGIATILLGLGVVAQLQGDYDSAHKYYQRSLDLAQALGDRKVISGILNNLGLVAQSQGDYDAARKYYQQSLDLAQALGDRQVIANILLNLGTVAQLQGDYDAARKYYQQSLDLAQALGDRQGTANILLNLGLVAKSQGDDEGARKYYQQSLDLAQALGDRKVIASVLGNLGIVALSQGDYGSARKYSEQSLDLAQALGDRQVIASILGNLGEVARGQGDYAAARKSYQESLVLAQALGDRYVIGRVLWGQARVAAKTGQKAEARKLLDQAIQVFAMLGDPALAVAKQERAALGDSPDPLQCRKTCDELQAKGELSVPVAECVKKLCAD